MAAVTPGTVALRLAVTYRAYFAGFDFAAFAAKINAALAATPVNGHARLACELQPNPSVRAFWIDRWFVRNDWRLLVLSFLHIDAGVDMDALRQAFLHALVSAGVPASHQVVEFDIGHMTASEAQASTPPPLLAPTAPAPYVLWKRSPGPGEAGFVGLQGCSQGASGGNAGGGTGATGGGTAAPPGGSGGGPIGSRIPASVTGARMTGTEFAASLVGLSEDARDQVIYDAAVRGNIPSFIRNLVPITVTASGHTATYRIMPDMLAIGTDEDYLYAPLKPRTAQRLADAWNMLLPTTKVVGDVYNNAAVKLVPHPLMPASGESRSATRLYVESNRRIRESKGTRSGLVSGAKKNVVISTALTVHPGKVLIFGWYYPTLAQAKAGMGANQSTVYIQPHSWVHGDAYVDYSHGIQFIDSRMVVDGAERSTAEVLQDSNLHRLLSSESAPLRSVKYPTS